MPKWQDRRFTLYYLFKGNEHTLQFPAKDRGHAIRMAGFLWRTLQDAMNQGYRDHPSFVKLCYPNGKVIRWTP